MRWPIVIAAVLGCTSVHPQGFNVVNLPDNDQASRGVSVREVPEGYLVFGDKFDQDLQYRAHVELHGMNGELIWERALVDAAQSTFGYSDPVSPTLGQDGWVASVALYAPESMAWRAYRFDAAGDTLWTRSLLNGSLLYPRAAAQQGGSYYFSSLYQEDATDTVRAVIARLDGTGSLMDVREFPGLGYDVLTLRAGQGSDLLLAGGKADAIFPFRSVVLRLDTGLNVVWSRDILAGVSGFSGYSSYVSKVIPDADGDVLVGGTCYYENVSSGIPLAEFYILKLSRTNGSVIWSRRYPVSISDFGSLHDLELLPDGDMVSCGYVTPPDAAGFQGCIYRYTPDGQTRWHRYYRFLTNPDAFNQLMDVEPTGDGGFILTGTTQLSLQFATVLWLLRLDEHGCVEPGCQSVGVDELLIGLPEDALRCGPVPTSDHLTVSLDLPETFGQQGKLRLVITDLAGREVHVEHLPDGRRQQADLRVEPWGSGTYVVHLADDTRLLASRKIVVQ